MLDLTNVKYKVICRTEKEKEYDITDYICDLGWEENENEISERISFSAVNQKAKKGVIASILKPGCEIAVFASVEKKYKEAARGYIENWKTSNSSSGNKLTCICYDILYNLQKSQDSRFFASGTGTEQAVKGILNDWKIPVSVYNGPNVQHGKTVCNSKYLSAIILDLLDDAAKKGAQKSIIRASEGKAQIIPLGTNKTIFVFRKDNTSSVNKTISTENLITRVQIVGQADDDGKRSVEATVNGLTQYGIRQRIYNRGSDESSDAANKAANEILNDEGKIKKTMSVTSPDYPFLRKGDVIYFVHSGKNGSYYYVTGIQHDADSRTMTMSLELAEKKESSNKQNSGNGKQYNVGDIVNFHGGTHYFSSYPGARGSDASAGKAKITQKDGSGKAHPWHLVHTDSQSNVYGWVDDGTFD